MSFGCVIFQHDVLYFFFQTNRDTGCKSHALLENMLESCMNKVMKCIKMWCCVQIEFNSHLFSDKYDMPGPSGKTMPFSN